MSRHRARTGMGGTGLRLVAALGAVALLLAGCGPSSEAQAVAQSCQRIPGMTAESCQCYARELENKLRPELMRVASFAQTEPARLLDPSVIGNLSANDIMTVTRVTADALRTCKIV